MLIDLTFRDLTPAQAVTLLTAATDAGIALNPTPMPVTALRVAAGAPPAPVVDQAATFPISSAQVTAPASAVTAAREPGSDDGPPLSEEDAAFHRCPTVKSVVKMLVEGQAEPDPAAVLKRCEALRAAGVAALEAVPVEQLADRVASSLAALGF